MTTTSPRGLVEAVIKPLRYIKRATSPPWHELLPNGHRGLTAGETTGQDGDVALPGSRFRAKARLSLSGGRWRARSVLRQHLAGLELNLRRTLRHGAPRYPTKAHGTPPSPHGDLLEHGEHAWRHAEAGPGWGSTRPDPVRDRQGARGARRARPAGRRCGSAGGRTAAGLTAPVPCGCPPPLLCSRPARAATDGCRRRKDDGPEPPLVASRPARPTPGRAARAGP